MGRRKSQWDYKPEAWKHMSKRKDYGCLIMFIFMFITTSSLCMLSCSKSDTIDDNNEEKYLSISEIKGTWTDNKDLYFISLGDNNRYSFCFSNELMGAGHFELKNNNIILYNDYLYSTDTLSIALKNNQLSINGSMYKFKQTEKATMNALFSKSSELTPISMCGKKISFLPGLSVYYDNLSKKITYQTDYIAKYE